LEVYITIGKYLQGCQYFLENAPNLYGWAKMFKTQSDSAIENTATVQQMQKMFQAQTEQNQLLILAELNIEEVCC